MNGNTSITIIVIGFLAFATLGIVFGGSAETTKIKEEEKTKQIYYQYKIDSLKAAQK